MSLALSDPLKVVEHKSVRMHHLASLFSNFSLQVKISYQSVSYCTRKRPCFYVFIFVLQFQIVSNAATIHDLDTWFSIISLQFQIDSDTYRMHALETLFSFFLCSPKSFQIPLERML